MGQLTSIAQGHFRNADRQVTQIEQLQALVTEKDRIIAAREETILHREDQINESDAMITQRNTIIEFLRSRSTTSSLRLMMPMLKSMNSNSSQYLLLYPHPKQKKIQRKSSEFQTLIPSMETRSLILSQVTPRLAVSPPWAISTIFSSSKSSIV
jgi:hypothetical protein